jgi:hypothetical protein
MLGGSRHRRNLWCLRQRRIRDVPAGVLNPPLGPNFPKNFDLVATLQMSDSPLPNIRQFSGFIAVSASEPTSWVLALRGTEDLMAWWDDFH